MSDCHDGLLSGEQLSLWPIDVSTLVRECRCEQLSGERLSWWAIVGGRSSGEQLSSERLSSERLS